MANIAYIAYNIYGIGGTVRHVVNNANYFVQHKHSVLIISISRTSDEPRLALDKRVTVISLKDSRPGAPKSFWRRILSRPSSILIDRDEDLYANFSLYTDIKLLLSFFKLKKHLVICTIPSFFFLARFFRRRSCRLIAQEHKGFERHSHHLQQRIIHSYKTANLIHCVNRQDVTIYRNMCPSTQVLCIGNCLTLPDTCTLGVNKILLAVGRLSPEKGFPRLLRLFKNSETLSRGWRLFMYGAGEEEDELKRLIRCLELENNVLLLPPTPHISALYGRASLYLSSSLSESFGLTMLEAMAFGLPVVAFETDGAKELVHHGVTGFLVPQQDESGFIRAMDTLTANGPLRRRMGQAAKDRASSFSCDRVNTQWLRIVERLQA